MNRDHTGAEHLLALDLPVAPAEIGQLATVRLASISLIFFDCDGVLTDGRIWVDAQGNESKAFSVVDGHGVAMLREAGVLVGLITRSPEGIPTARARKLRFDLIRTGVMDKAAAVRDILAERGIPAAEVAFMGDDLPDLAAFDLVGLTIAPPTARPQVLARAQATTRALPGHGAVREVCDALIVARKPI